MNAEAHAVASPAQVCITAVEEEKRTKNEKEHRLAKFYEKKEFNIIPV